MEGTLREGDEILEVNGHSLIGVSREGAIDFLKEVCRARALPPHARLTRQNKALV